ncbi:exodeoxyribonuclease I [Saccharobesus litoralis]|uniref:Exodeoxyribonuclease I n=1 Tax=Saccharobesus litoralis TaxID=2172099 RepID=A0A2S0VU12_9ALTE|nr:exodeoxyribonuclease I [Saccharobesus litoralis]AWB67707.1 exodeoxyribonuclease I [Saccharobesus litoralis]
MSQQQSPSILWYDFETWGTSPKYDRPCQFAGIRTNYDLEIIGEPLNFYCYPASDYLPQPQACLITGITPQLTFKKGTNEHQFMKKIHHELMQPNTVSCGYNTIRFDDEVTRYSLYRNLFEPFSREWKNGNSRWDIIDMVRTCYALRPEDIEWPEREPGIPSFKLEHLTKANGLEHYAAHDALSDVYATIDIAKLIKSKQPKLFSYLFSLRNKHKVKELLDLEGLTPLVHISSKIPSSQGCCTWIVPIAWHPTNANAVIVLDLTKSAQPLTELDTQALKQKLFTSSQDLQPDEERLPIKLVHINKSPVLATAKSLSPDNAERLGIDRQQCLTNLQWIKQNHSAVKQKVIDLYQAMEFETESDADFALYDGFIQDNDKQWLEKIQCSQPEHYAAMTPAFNDPRLQTLWFRFKARNYPDTLNEAEQLKWQVFCRERLTQNIHKTQLTLEEFAQELENLAETVQNDESKIKILKALYQYIQNL